VSTSPDGSRRRTALRLPPTVRAASSGRGEGEGVGTPGGTIAKLSVMVTVPSPAGPETGGMTVGGRTCSSFSFPSMTAA
jgi:hypothetical protein